MRQFRIVFAIVSISAIACLQTASAQVRSDIQTQSPLVDPPLSVRINEIMASNVRTVADPQGEYDDWIEIANVSDSAVDVARDNALESLGYDAMATDAHDDSVAVKLS